MLCKAIVNSRTCECVNSACLQTCRRAERTSSDNFVLLRVCNQSVSSLQFGERNYTKGEFSVIRYTSVRTFQPFALHNEGVFLRGRRPEQKSVWQSVLQQFGVNRARMQKLECHWAFSCSWDFSKRISQWMIYRSAVLTGEAAWRLGVQSELTDCLKGWLHCGAHPGHPLGSVTERALIWTRRLEVIQPRSDLSFCLHAVALQQALQVLLRAGHRLSAPWSKQSVCRQPFRALLDIRFCLHITW